MYLLVSTDCLLPTVAYENRQISFVDQPFTHGKKICRRVWILSESTKYCPRKNINVYGLHTGLTYRCIYIHDIHAYISAISHFLFCKMWTHTHVCTLHEHVSGHVCVLYIYRRSTVLVCMYMYAYTSFSITVSTVVVGGVLCRPALGARPRGGAGQTHPRPAGQQPLRHCHPHHRAASVEVRGQIRLMVIVNVGTPGIQEHVSAMCQSQAPGYYTETLGRYV